MSCYKELRKEFSLLVSEVEQLKMEQAQAMEKILQVLIIKRPWNSLCFHACRFAVPQLSPVLWVRNIFLPMRIWLVLCANPDPHQSVANLQDPPRLVPFKS
jgi:hypothetical protein